MIAFLCVFVGILWSPALGTSLTTTDDETTRVENALRQLIESWPLRIEETLSLSGVLGCSPDKGNYSAKVYGLATAVTVADSAVESSLEIMENLREKEPPIKCSCTLFIGACRMYTCTAKIKIAWLRILFDSGKHEGKEVFFNSMTETIHAVRQGNLKSGCWTRLTNLSEDIDFDRKSRRPNNEIRNFSLYCAKVGLEKINSVIRSDCS